MQESSSKPSLQIFLKDTNPRNQQQPLNTQISESAENCPHPTVGRPGGRPTPSTGRPVGRLGAQQRVGYLQSVDSVDRPVDRSSDTAGGRPGRSTEFLILRAIDRAGRPVTCTCCFSAAVLLLLPSSFFRRPPWRSLDDPRRSLSTSPSVNSLFPTILHLGEDSSKSEPISNVPQSITWRNRHTISACAHQTKSTHDLGEIDTRSRRNRL